MSYAPAVPEGRSRAFSRATAIVLAVVALKTLRFGQPLWFIFAFVSVCAFESNRYRLSSIARLLSVVAQLGVGLGFCALGVAIALYAESGRQAPVLRGVAVLLVVGIALMALQGLVAAVGTLRSSVAEP